MKEDVLEQLVDDYLRFNGFFTDHNVKFQPAYTERRNVKRDGCTASDLNVIGLPCKRKNIGELFLFWN